MVKRGNYSELLIFLLIFLFLFLPLTSANFACGQVESEEKISASWFNVRVYYGEDVGNYVLCKVSPSENKYCCDPQEIGGSDWEIGKEIFAKILDSGYSAGPVSQIISGEGYDIFPVLKLKKVIQIKEPSKTIYVNDTNLFVNISTFYGFNNLSYILNHFGEIVADEEICSDCDNVEFYLNNLDFGQYELELIATNEIGERVSEKKNFTILEYLNFDREIECERCEKNFVPRNTEVRIIVYLNSSHNLSGKLYDYFPSNWKLLKDDKFEEYSETHNRIFWEVKNKKDIKKIYLLESPSDILPRKYYFKSQFEDFEGELFKVFLYGFGFLKTNFFSLSKKFSQDEIEKIASVEYSTIFSSTPLVIDLDNNFLYQVTIFPKKTIKNAKAFILENKHKTAKNSLFDFVLRTNTPKRDVEKILIRFRIEKTKLKDSSKISLYRVDSSTNKLETKKYREDLEYNYYQAYSSMKGFFSIRDENG